MIGWVVGDARVRFRIGGSRFRAATQAGLGCSSRGTTLRQGALGSDGVGTGVAKKCRREGPVGGDLASRVDPPRGVVATSGRVDSVGQGAAGVQTSLGKAVMIGFVTEVRGAISFLGRRPTFTLVAIATLALGLGSTLRSSRLCVGYSCGRCRMRNLAGCCRSSTTRGGG